MYIIYIYIYAYICICIYIYILTNGMESLISMNGAVCNFVTLN